MVEREGGEQLLNVHEVREFDDDPCCIVWPAARVLLLWLQTNLEAQLGATLRGAKIIELRAGTGFLALSLANAGAQNILAVEGAEHGFMNLEHNISTSRTTAVTPLQWDWEKQPDIPSEVPPVLDLVLGSDIVYPRHYNGDALCGTVFRLLTRGLEVEPLVLLSLCDRAIISDSSTASSSLRIFLKHARVSELPVSEEVFLAALGTSAGGKHEDPGAASGTESHIRMFWITASDERNICCSECGTFSRCSDVENPALIRYIFSNGVGKIQVCVKTCSLANDL